MNPEAPVNIFQGDRTLVSKVDIDAPVAQAKAPSDCYSPVAVTTWWLVLRLCLTPLFHALTSTKSAPPEPSPS